MARSEARIYTDIWEDGDFLALDSPSQRLYMFLLSQPDLAHSGVIPLRERRWARKTTNCTTSEIEHALKMLEGHFLVVDWDTEEVLIRSLIRRDRIFRQPNVMRAAIDHVPLVQSGRILNAIGTEVARIRHENTELSVHQEAALADMEKALADRLKAVSGNPFRNPSADPTPEVPGVRGDTTDLSNGFPVPRSPDPGSADALLPLAPLAETATAEPKTKKKRRQDRPDPEADPDFMTAWQAYTRKDNRAGAYDAWVKARNRATVAEITDGIRRFVAYEIARGTEIKYLPHLATWLNQDRWRDPMTADQRPTDGTGLPSNVVALRGGQTSPIKSTTDERVKGWLALRGHTREANA